jgi:RNA polymerase sigma-70 factor (ECF subfamily)
MSSKNDADGRQRNIDWREVYQENLPRIYNYLRFRIGDDSVAEDLTSSTFEKAWRNRKRYKSQVAEFSTWLFAIASNLAIDHLRKQRVEVGLSALNAGDSSGSAEQAVELREDYLRLLESLEALPARDRHLFSLKHGAGLKNRQIAKLTGLTESNVGTILHRIAKRLRADLGEEE